MTAKYVEGDHGTIIRRHVKDQNGVVLDITGGTVFLCWSQNNIVQRRPMTLTDPVNGIAEYIVQAGDLVFVAGSPGPSFELEYNDSTGNRYTTPVLDGPYEIRKPICAVTPLAAAKRAASAAHAAPA